jgi:hypothetical protein
MFENAALRKVTRGRLRSGTLPSREPDHTWEGPGLGAACGICEKLVTGDEIGYEIQFARPGNVPGLDRYHLHAACFTLWELERTKLYW